jgi:hypothetical protein
MASNRAFSLHLDEDRVPLTLQVLATDLLSSLTWTSSKPIEVTLSDGAYFSPMFFCSQLLSITHLLSIGDVIINNYTSHSVIGNPSEYKLQPTSCIISRNPNFIGVSSDDFCDLCDGTPFDWSLYGQSIVDSVQGTITTSHSTDL